jgi:hypothetical protein
MQHCCLILEFKEIGKSDLQLPSWIYGLDKMTALDLNVHGQVMELTVG